MGAAPPLARREGMTVGSGRAVPDAGLVVAVDIGTTGVKAARRRCRGESGHAEREYPTTSPHPGWAVQDPEAVTTAVVAVVREVMADVTAAGHTVAGIAFSSAMHSLIALGPDGSPLTPSVIWADEPALPQARRLRESGDWLTLHCRTGTPVHPMSPLVKLLWFREQDRRSGGAPPIGWASRSTCCCGWPGCWPSTSPSPRPRDCTGWPPGIGTPTRSTSRGRGGTAAEPARHHRRGGQARPGGGDVGPAHRDAGRRRRERRVLANVGVGASHRAWWPARSARAARSGVWSRRLASTRGGACSATCSSRAGGSWVARRTTAATCCAGLAG